MSNNLTLNLEKIQFKQFQVSFYGHCWSKHGISPDPKKIEALNHRYSAVSAHSSAPLSALTHQAVDYKPGKVHFENFNGLNVEISNMKVLPYFDVNAETTLQIDASKKGLGACIIQKGKVVYYASRSLTKT